MEERIGAHRVVGGNLRGRGHSKDLDVSGRVILKCIFKKYYEGSMGCIC
jgi:hypothetical protein